jgi:REP element-mobilizing transposase RayT
MHLNRPERQRKAIRLQERDYRRPGGYFLTICTYQRLFLFGEMLDGAMTLSATGALVQSTWKSLAEHFPSISADSLVVMPNHLHGIVWLKQAQGGQRLPTLGQVVAYLKYQVTKEANRLQGEPGGSVWQRNYYERVIRDDGELDRVRQYISNNPANWRDDEENPLNARAV